MQSLLAHETHPSTAMEDAKGHYALVVMQPDNPSGLLLGGKERRTGSTIGSCLHSRVARQYSKGRSRARDIVEAVPPLGPARNAAYHEALGNFASKVCPDLIAEHDGVPIVLHDELVAFTCPANKLLPLLERLDALFHSPFIEVGSSPARLMMPGADVGLSARVLVASSIHELDGDKTRELQRRFRDEQLGKPAELTMYVLRHETITPIWGGSWKQLPESFRPLLEQLHDQHALQHVADVLTPIQDAVADPDLGKSAKVRTHLVASVLEQAKIGNDSEQSERIASAVCHLVDESMRVMPHPTPHQAMETLRFASLLAGGAA